MVETHQAFGGEADHTMAGFARSGGDEPDAAGVVLEILVVERESLLRSRTRDTV